MNLDLRIELKELPKCQKCPKGGLVGELLPFDDNLPDTQVLFTKGWCCNSCGWYLILYKGKFQEGKSEALGVGR